MKIRFSDVVNHLTIRRWMVSVTAVGAAVLVWGAIGISGQDDPLVKTEPLTTVMQRTEKEKPTFVKRQQDLLAGTPGRALTLFRATPRQGSVDCLGVTPTGPCISVRRQVNGDGPLRTPSSRVGPTRVSASGDVTTFVPSLKDLPRAMGTGSRVRDDGGTPREM